MDLIDRQTAIDAIWKVRKEECDHGKRFHNFCSLSSAIAILECEVPTVSVDDITECITPHWIPCDKKLPEEVLKEYWVCTDGGYQCECRWTNINHIWTDLTINWHWHICDIPQYSKVVAWRELPEPYNKEIGGENEDI